jgi:hypothetical protein
LTAGDKRLTADASAVLSCLSRRGRVKPVVKRVGVLLVALLGVGAAGGGGFVFAKTSAFDASMEKTYDIPVPTVTRSTDPVVLERGKHLVESLAACNGKDCHGADLAGGHTIAMGPVATLTGPNITPSGLLSVYKDADLFRLVRHGVKLDGRSVRFMPVQDFGWLPDADVVAMISYLRTVPAVDRPNGPTSIGTLGKVLDRTEKLPLDVARHIPHDKLDLAPPPSESKEYGRYVGKLCTGCHGEQLSGGPIPGAPSDFAVPLNLTPDATGLRGWTFEDLDKLLTVGVRKNGAKMDPLMPTENFGKMNDTEKKALYAYLMSLPPRPFGGR